MADGTEHTGAGDTGDPSGTDEFRIFLNYRREDASGHAGRLYDSLRHGEGESPHFRREQIFMDIDTLAPGANFPRVIGEAVGSCNVFIAVIGRQWLSAVDSSGRRRLDNARDFVRLEIEAALARDIPVVPALVQGAEMPMEEELPETFHAFLDRNAVELSDARWSYDVGRLVTWLKTVEEEAARERARRDLLEREAAERERLDREAVEQAERERQEQQAAERAEREREQQQAAEQMEREQRAAAALRRPGSRLGQKLPAKPIPRQLAGSVATFVGKGWKHYESDRYDEALASFQAALALDPKSVAALEGCGSAYNQTDRYDEALASFQAALALDPESIAALEGRGWASLKTDRFDDALASFGQVLARDRESVSALVGRGWAYSQTGRTDEALASFDTALELDPDNVLAREGRASALGG